MTILFLLLIVLGLSAQQAARKTYNIKVAGGALTFSAGSVVFAALFFLVSGGTSWDFSSDIWIYSLLFALSYGLAIVSSVIAVQYGPLALTALFIQCSLMIPTVYGLLVLDEPFGIPLLIGVILLLISLFFVNLSKEKNASTETKKISFKWATWVFLSFLGNGVCSTVQRVQQINHNGHYKNEFMLLALVVVAVILFCLALFIERKTLWLHLKRGFVWYGLCGSANGIVNLLVLALSLSVPASVMFPIVSAGGILLTTLLSVTVYKENLSRNQLMGLGLGIAAIVALNL